MSPARCCVLMVELRCKGNEEVNAIPTPGAVYEGVNELG